MIGSHSVCRVLRHAPIAALLLLALLIASPPVQAGEPISVQSTVSAHDSLVAGPAVAVLPIAADRYGWLWTLLENTLNNRARMIQFGLVGVAIALYIMFRARG